MAEERQLKVVAISAEYESEGDYFSHRPTFKIPKLYMKVLAVIFLFRPHNSKLPINQLHFENLHKSVKFFVKQILREVNTIGGKFYFKK